MIKMFPNINNMKIYLVCGKTDLRKGIDGLAALVTEAFSLDAYDNAIFLFCGTRSDRSSLPVLSNQLEHLIQLYAQL